MDRIKLIWDFRGPDAPKIATHHELHLKEYARTKALKKPLTATQIISDYHTIAFLVVDKDAMKPVRDDLKPHRGQLYTETL